MYRLVNDSKSKIIFAGFLAVLFLCFSIMFVPTCKAYYSLSGLGLYGMGLYGLSGLGMLGLYGGLGGLYGLGGVGISGTRNIYGGGALGDAFYGGLYGLMGLCGLGSLYGMGLYGLGGLGTLGLYGCSGGLYGLGGLGMSGLYGCLGGLYGLGGLGLYGGLGSVSSLLSSLMSSPQTKVAPTTMAPATVSALLPLLPLPVAPLFIAEQTGTWMGTWTNGLLSGPMTLNLIDALGLISGTAQLLGNPSLGSLVDITGTVLNAQITVSGTGIGLGGMTFALDIIGILIAADQMTGTYSIINTSGGTVVDQGRFDLTLIAPII